jgi:hypothetical protein
MAPNDSIIEHLLFALKHEGVDLYVLACGLKQVSQQEMQAAVDATPNGMYVRVAAHLWESLTGGSLSVNAAVTAPYHSVFDPDLYIVGDARRDPKWRVDFNGLGDLTFCPVVRKTPEIQALMHADILGQVHRFVESAGQDLLDRALSWAYLSETEGSYSLEGEIPSTDKSKAFVHLLKHASDPQPLDEDTLCEWQRLTVAHARDHAFEYRSEQNRLQKGTGAAGVRYVPPAPEHVVDLMDGLVKLANERPAGIDPLVHASIISFGFVFIHPFMDGNGRLSRFLVHHSLGQSGALPRAVVLPISVAMKRHEDEYLQALTAYSRPARDLCDVRWAAGEEYDFRWLPHAKEAFQYMDLTAQAEFTLQMAQAAMEKDLLQETRWLMQFDQVFEHIDKRYNIRSGDLSDLITIAFQNGGTISNSKRKTYSNRVDGHVMDAIDEACSRCLREAAQDAGHPDDDGLPAQEHA